MNTIQKIVIAYAIIANIVGLSVMGIDKRRAICHKWRIPENITAIYSGFSLSDMKCQQFLQCVFFLHINCLSSCFD